MNQPFLFGKQNYLLMGAGLLSIAIGYVLMQGGGSTDPNVFNPEIFSPRRIIIAPMFVLLGFVLEAVAILRRPKA
jgi:hypothetical protein